MQNIDQIYLYMKEEIERQAKNEENAILEEVKALEEEAYTSMKKEAKRDADLKLKQEEEEINSQAASEISEIHTDRTKKLINKRDEYVKAVFDEAKKELIEFSQSDEYITFMKAKTSKVADTFKDTDAILYLKEDDLSLKDELLKTLGYEIEVKVSKDIKIGGIMIEDLKNALIVDETLDFALNNQKEWFNKNSGLIIR
ncbi:MAG: V-type ATP synthase subunit E [Erysipelotrichaceae bacterium]|nr:V-type ATP synthase subunit E [Erysipelotrichaceae bacterium]